MAVVNGPNPGLCRTGLQREFKGTIAGAIFGIFKKILARTSDLGTHCIKDAAINHGNDSYGQYLEDGNIKP